MHRACSRLRQRNPNLFIVGSMFANNEQGAWYDPSDLNTLFQDAAGTIPVTTTGQPVGRMLDKSGRGNHATQSTAGSRPIFRDANGLRYLEFDGVDDSLSTGSIDFTVTDKVNVFAGARKLNDASGTAQSLAEFGDSSSVAGTFAMFAPFTSGQPRYDFRSRGTIAANVTSAAAFAAPNSAVITGIGDISGDICRIRVNGSASDVTSATDQGTGTYTTTTLSIGRRGGATLPFNGHLYGLIVRGSLSDAATISATERYLAAKTGVTLS